MSILNVTGETENNDPLRALVIRELREASLSRREEAREEQKEGQRREREERRERNRRWREEREERAGGGEVRETGWSDVLAEEEEEAREEGGKKKGKLCSLQ
jgi:hypothetical protein